MSVILFTDPQSTRTLAKKNRGRQSIKVLRGGPTPPSGTRNVCIRQATLWKFALGLRALVAMHMHVVCVRSCLQTSSVVTDNCNSMFCRAVRSQKVLCVPLQSPKSQRRGSRSLSCYVCMRGAARERAEPPPKHPKGQQMTL